MAENQTTNNSNAETRGQGTRVTSTHETNSSGTRITTTTSSGVKTPPEPK